MEEVCLVTEEVPALSSRARSASVHPATCAGVAGLLGLLCLAAAHPASRSVPLRLGDLASVTALEEEEEGRDARSILPHVAVMPYGVLGVRMQGRSVVRKAVAPTEQTAVVDPAGLPFIQRAGPSRAGGASGAIYEWAGLNHENAFPEDVRKSVLKAADAKFHRYGEHLVIHVVGPDLRGASASGGKTAEANATAQLAQAYAQVLSEFLDSNATALRLLPISGGIYAGDWVEAMPRMTFGALSQGFEKLPPKDQERLLVRLGSSHIEMCIFMDSDFKLFQSACTACGTPAQT